MLTSISRLRRPGAVALLGAAFAVGASACGDDDASSQPKQSTNAAVTAGPVLQAEPDPDQLKCAHLANHENYGVLYDTTVAMAKSTRQTDGSTHQVATRIGAAMNDLCGKQGDPAYRPAADAVAAVKSGGYKSQTSIP